MKEKDNSRGGVKARRLFIYTFLLILVLLYLASRQQRLASEAEQKVQEMKKEEQKKQEKLKDKAAAGGALVLEEEDMWSLMLTNETHPVRDDYKPTLKQIEGTEEYVDERIYAELLDMINAAQQEGLHPIICSGYRTKEEQTRLFENKKQQYIRQGLTDQEAYDKAKQTVSVPESGEHRLGIAADIYSRDYPYLETEFENTPEGKWLREHAPEYGFILRYDKGKEGSTGIQYEPWHFRYVGKKAAQYMAKNNLSLEEFYIEESLYE